MIRPLKNVLRIPTDLAGLGKKVPCKLWDSEARTHARKHALPNNRQKLIVAENSRPRKRSTERGKAYIFTSFFSF